jgi:cytochrome bd-type quinol oxidase subunit 2
MTSSTSAISGVSALIALIAVKLTHLQALVIFALVISVAFGFLGRRNPRERVKYILWTLLLFLLVGAGIGWAMYPFSH